jgi:hydrophobic/amphiphilic exporter-1 (mainly G- bacteria), HAE1 family
MSLTDLAIRRPVATTMLYLIVVSLGAVAFFYLPVDLLPRIEFPRLSVTVSYPNVGPEEIETIITDPLENALSGIPQLERLTSRSEEGRSRITLEFGQQTSIDEAANDVRAALDRIRDDLPIEAEPPAIWKFDADAQEIVSLSVASRRDLSATTRLLERELSQRFEQIPGVGAITIVGGVYREIQVQLHRDRLRAAGLTGDDVAAALRTENVQLPGGNVRSGVSDLYVRTLGEYRDLVEIGSTVVSTSDTGVPIRVRDLAAVVDGYQDVGNLAEVNGRPVVRLRVQKQSGANTVAVVDRIREEVAAINAEREDVHVTVDRDQSLFIRESMANVRSSALFGGLLAVVVLYVFLRNGASTGIIALAIPISIVAAFAVLYFAGLTLNQMTFGGLALGIGMIVDNAIVVIENIVRQRQQGRDATAAASVGTREVAGAVIASTLTTCVIFLPVVFMRTTSGQLFQTLALVVVFTLGCSLLVALTLVPVLAARLLTAPEDTGAAPASRVSRAFAWLDLRYEQALSGALANRGLVVSVTLLLVLVAGAFWTRIPVELAPELDTDTIDVELEMGRGTSIAVARAYLDELERVVRPVLPEGQVASVATQMWSDNAEVEIRLVDASRRTIDPSVLADRLREATAGRIPGAEVRVDAQSGLWILRRIFSASGGDEAVEVQLRGYDLATAVTLAREVRTRMEQVPGVVEVDVSQEEGRPERNLYFDRARIADVGLSVQDVAAAVQTGVAGRLAGYFREGGEQFPITVRLRPDDRLSADDLRALPVRAPGGQVLPLSALVRAESARGPTTIDRIDGQRVTYITANLATGVALGDAVAGIRGATADLPMPSGFSLTFGGAWREQQRASRDFAIAIVLALGLVYMVMAGQFERYVDPLLVMTSVPVALVGVVPALLLTGTTLNVQSVMGIVMLVGIVVNNAIVLVDYINLRRREDGLAAREAAIASARARLRPILMTTATTVLGLLPLALGWGEGAGLQAPLARVVVGGLTASTLVTLLLVPVLYVTMAQWRERQARAPQPQPTPSRA